MNWEAIAAIGRVAGALGVIASLGYLAVQIRQNTRQIRQNIEVSQVASYNQTQEQTWQTPLMISGNDEALRVFAKFSEQGIDALDAEEAGAVGGDQPGSPLFMEVLSDTLPDDFRAFLEDIFSRGSTLPDAMRERFLLRREG